MEVWYPAEPGVIVSPLNDADAVQLHIAQVLYRCKCTLFAATKGAGGGESLGMQCSAAQPL